MESLHYLLMKSHTALNRQIISAAADLGLTPGQPKILDYLYHFDDNNQKAIADYCEIEPATLGGILRRMESAGFIRRYQQNGDRRSLYVGLTERGKEIAKKMETVFNTTDARAAAALSEAETVQLKTLLEKVCGAAQEKPDKEAAQ